MSRASLFTKHAARLIFSTTKCAAYAFSLIGIASFYGCLSRSESTKTQEDIVLASQAKWMLFEGNSRSLLSNLSENAYPNLTAAKIAGFTLNRVNENRSMGTFGLRSETPLPVGRTLLTWTNESGEEKSQWVMLSHPLVLNVVADWDGELSAIANLPKLKQARNDYSWLRVTQFLGPYFLSKTLFTDSEMELVKAHLKSLPQDEVGMHLHTHCHYLKLVNIECKVEADDLFLASYMTSFNLWDAMTESQKRNSRDPGMLTIVDEAYTVKQIAKMFRFGKELFQSNDFERPVSFKAAGWTSGPNTIAALEKEGFLYDSSPIPTEHLQGSTFEGSNLDDYLQKTWSQISWTSQPFYPFKKLVDTGVKWTENKTKHPNASSILSFPGNTGMADYMTFDRFKSALEQNWNLRDPLTEMKVINYGWHPESFSGYLYKIEQTLSFLEKHLALSGRGPLLPLTLKETAKLAQPE